MYPNIMIAYNISPDIFFGRQEKMEEGTYNEAPEVGYRFRKAPDGFFKKILVNLIQTRKKIKQEMKKLDKRDQRYAVLDVRQYTVKILTNSFYGYTGWLGAKWYRKECAEATAAWGRFIIKSVIERAKEWGFDVYYGDTDSIFCTYSDKIPQFVEAINKEFPLDLDVQELYTAIFFTGKKKRYAGLTANGEIIIRGLEVRRGDWCELAKKIQKEIIGIILQQRDVKPAEELVKKTIENIRGGNVSIDDLTIYKSLTRRLDEYKSKQAHVRAVEKAMEEGLDFNVGEKVGYVVLKNKPKTKKSAERLDHGGLESKDGEKMSDRTKLVSLLDESDKIDYEYYIDKQILPAALRILEYFGTSEESLKNVPKQAGLDKWF
jgi:DNA polymerase I